MPRRQRASWGSNEPAGPGRRRLRYWADKRDGRGYRRCSETIAGTRKDGDRRLAELRLAHDGDAPCPTLGQAYRAWWLPDARARLAVWEREGRPARKRGELLKPATMERYESAWRAHVGPRWGTVPVSDISYGDVQDWLDGKGEGAAVASMALMRQVLRFCQMRGAVAHNVCDERYRMPCAKADRDHGNYSLSELVDRLWPATVGTGIEAAFILSAFASARPGESLGPLAEEVERVERRGMVLAVVPLVRQAGRYGGASRDGDMKNRQSERVAVVPEPFSTRLLAIAGEMRSRGLPYLSDDGTGSPMGTARTRAIMKGAMESAGLPAREFRSLRRSWRTWSATSGIPAELLEKMMGHVGFGVTGRHYLDPGTDQLVDTVARAFTENRIVPNWDYLGQT